MKIIKLTPACKDYIWGGENLVTKYNKTNTNNSSILAETWELSTHKDGPSFIANGAYKGKLFSQYINENNVLGTNCDKFNDFPILVKFIDAKEKLSIQVHPNDEYALKNENKSGKTEVWYVADCKKGAFLYLGFNREVSKQEFKQHIENNTLLEVLNKFEVQKGDVFFIEAGTVHSIGKDIIIAEIQQNSNITYRVYDYGRKCKDGNTRELHIDKALQVTTTRPLQKYDFGAHIATCEYFTVDKLDINSNYVGIIDTKTFVNILVLEGDGEISVDDETLSFKKGDCFFLPAQTGHYTITGTMEALVTTIK